MRVDCIRSLIDNQVYFLWDEESGKTAVIDPSEAGPVLDYISRFGCELDYIINTHHHHDHTGGNLKLKQETRAQVIANQKDSYRIPGFDLPLGEIFHFGKSSAEIIYTPGHTKGHICLLFNGKYLFCGDTLFVAGCGRLLEGSAQELHGSLRLLAALPDETMVFCGHDYCLANLAFSLAVDENNPEIPLAIAEAKAGKSLIPSTIGAEKLINPFLRLNVMKASLGLEGCSDLEVFTKLRAMKDVF